MLCLSGFELHSRWVPLKSAFQLPKWTSHNDRMKANNTQHDILTAPYSLVCCVCHRAQRSYLWPWFYCEILQLIARFAFVYCRIEYEFDLSNRHAIVNVNCKYLITHSPQGFSGLIYNTGRGTLPGCLRCSLQVMKKWIMMPPSMSGKVG